MSSVHVMADGFTLQVHYNCVHLSLQWRAYFSVRMRLNVILRQAGSEYGLDPTLSDKGNYLEVSVSQFVRPKEVQLN